MQKCLEDRADEVFPLIPTEAMCCVPFSVACHTVVSYLMQGWRELIEKTV